MKSIGVTLCTRPFYTREVLGAWGNVRGIRDWYWSFAVEPTTQAEAQMDIAREFLVNNGLDGEIRVNPQRLGVSENPHALLFYLFQKSDRVVLAEEDVLPSTDVLEYFDWAYDKCHIACAHTTEDGPEDQATTRRWFNPWLWQTDVATWRNVIRQTWDLHYETSDGRGPAGWDCNLGLRVVPDWGLQVLFPAGGSRSAHIGKHLGVHQDPSQHGTTEVPESFRTERAPCEWRLSPVDVLRKAGFAAWHRPPTGEHQWGDDIYSIPLGAEDESTDDQPGGV